MTSPDDHMSVPNGELPSLHTVEEGAGPAIADGNVLVLGGRPGAVEAIAASGLPVTVVAGPAQSARLRALRLVDQVLTVEEPTDVEECLLALARGGIDVSSFSVITSPLEHGLTAAAVLARLGEANGPALDTVVRFRDKHLQKSLLRDAGVPVAETLVIEDRQGLASAIRALGGEVVVKPVAGAGALHTERLTASKVPEWQRRAAKGPWLVEAFVPGREIHIDGVVRAGEVRHEVLSRYFVNIMEAGFGVENGSFVVPAGSAPMVEERARQLTRRALRVLGLRDGVFHLEAFEQHDGGLVFGECAFRVAGGLISQGVRLATGIDLHAEWAAAALGLPTVLVGQLGARDTVVGNLDLMTPAGTVHRIPTTEELLGQTGVVWGEMLIAADSGRGPTPRAAGRAGHVVISATSPARLRHLARGLMAWFVNGTEIECG